MLVYGELVSAQLENLAANPTGIAGRVFFDTVTTFAKYYNTGWHTLADLDSAQVFTNKDIDGGTAANTRRITIPKDTKANLDSLTRKAGTIVYATDGKKLYVDDGSNLQEIGSSTGGINYVLNTSGEESTYFWNSSNFTTTIDTTTSIPMYTTIAKAFKLVSSATSATFTTDAFQLDAIDLNRKLALEFAYSVATASNWNVAILNSATSGGSYTEVGLSTDDSSGNSYLPIGSSNYRTSVDTDSSKPWMKIQITSDANTTTGYFSNFTFSSGVVPQGAVVEAPKAIVFTTSGMGTTTQNLTQVRRGSYVFIYGTITLGTPTATFSITLPAGMTIDTSHIGDGYNAGATGNKFLSGEVVYNDAANTWDGRVSTDGTSSTTLRFASGGQSGSLVNYWGGSSLPVLPAAGHKLHLSIEIPIAEWAGNGTVNLAQNDMEYLHNSDTDVNDDNTTSFAYGPAGQAIVAYSDTGTVVKKRVRIQGGVLGVSKIPVLKVSPDGYLWLNACDVFPPVVSGGNYYGMELVAGGTASTDIDVSFGGDGAYPGVAWSSYTAWKWCVHVASSGQAVSFGEVQPNVSAGLVSKNGLKGKTNGVAVGAGYIGEVLSASLSNVNADVSPSLKNAGSLTLTAGVWLVIAKLMASTPATSHAYTALSISTTGTHDTTNLVSAVDTTLDAHMITTQKYVNVSTSTTVYMVWGEAYVGGTPGTNSTYEQFFAIRIA